MKIVKIIISFFLIYGIGREYIDASRQLGTFFSPGIIIATLLFLSLSAWLFGSALSIKRFKFKSLEFIKFYAISFMIFTIVAFLSLGIKPDARNFVLINGINIPIGQCIDGNVRVIPDFKEREEYCKCFIEKILNEPLLKEKYQDDLINNKINYVFKEVQSSKEFLELGIENCLSAVEMKWTDVLVNSMKRNWKTELKGTEMETTNNIDQYCDCLLDEFQKYPLEEIKQEEYLESKKAIDIFKKCRDKSLK